MALTLTHPPTSIVSDPVVSVADRIVDAGVYYLLHASTLRLLLLIL